MKIRTRAFLLGLFPTLLVAAVLTAFHLFSRLNELDAKISQQGIAMARHLASASEYGVISGNRGALENLLDQALNEPGVKSVAVVWPDRKQLARGEPIVQLQPLYQLGQKEIGERAWFIYPVQLPQLNESDPFLEAGTAERGPLAWVAVSLDLQQKQAIARQLLLASIGITLLGVALASLLIHRLALTGLKPLLDIIATVKRISSGSFGSSMEVTAHSPELRELQASVNLMSESLRSYQQDMEAKIGLVIAELENKRQEAEQANLAKSRFLAAASHDLRQPMHAIGLYVECLKLQVGGEKAEDTLSKLDRAVASMVELFNAILDVTKLDAGVVQPLVVPVRVRRLLHQLAEEFAAEAERKGLSLRVRAPDVWVESDAILLERIIRNLLTNALRNTVEGGVLLSARPRRGRLRLQVWDTGSGIAPEHQARIFDEFYQASAQPAQTRQGLGLGLAIVRRLARLLGHPLQLHSRPGRGTVFALDVPVLANPSCMIDDAVNQAPGGTLSGNALIVDDDPVILNAVGHLLRQWGMKVQASSSLDQVMQIGDAPDVVLADYQLLNGETGLMVAHAVRQRWGAHVPVVLITGDTRRETIQALRESGFPVLHKPVRVHQLRATLGRLLQAQPASPVGS